MGWCPGPPALAGPLAPGKSISIHNSPGPVLACALRVTFPSFTCRIGCFSQMDISPLMCYCCVSLSVSPDEEEQPS